MRNQAEAREPRPSHGSEKREIKVEIKTGTTHVSTKFVREWARAEVPPETYLDIARFGNQNSPQINQTLQRLWRQRASYKNLGAFGAAIHQRTKPPRAAKLIKKLPLSFQVTLAGAFCLLKCASRNERGCMRCAIEVSLWYFDLSSWGSR